MSVSADDIAFALDLFADLGALTTRKMMGGLCFYRAGQIFAILNREGVVYLKAKGPFAQELAQAGARQFGDEGGGRMGYWTLPEAALEDPQMAADWAQRALANI